MLTPAPGHQAPVPLGCRGAGDPRAGWVAGRRHAASLITKQRY